MKLVEPITKPIYRFMQLSLHFFEFILPKEYVEWMRSMLNYTIIYFLLFRPGALNMNKSKTHLRLQANWWTLHRLPSLRLGWVISNNNQTTALESPVGLRGSPKNRLQGHFTHKPRAVTMKL